MNEIIPFMSEAVPPFPNNPGPVEVLSSETLPDFTALMGSQLGLVSTLLTATASGPTVEAAIYGPPLYSALLTGAANDPGAGALARAATLADDQLVPTAGQLLALSVLLEPFRNGEAVDADAVVPSDLQDLITGTSEGLRRLADGAWAGGGTDARPAPQAGTDGPLDQLLRAIGELPGDASPGPQAGPNRGAPPPDGAPMGGPTRPPEGSGTGGRTSRLEVEGPDPGAGSVDPQDGGRTAAEWDFSVAAAWVGDHLPPESDPEDLFGSAPSPEDICPVWLLALFPTVTLGAQVKARVPGLKLPIRSEIGV